MLHKNNGHVLISTIIILAVIVIVSMTCISLVYSNSRILGLDDKAIKTEEISFSGIEMMRSNILYEIKTALENTNNKTEYFNYFQGNDSYLSFVNKIKDISNSNIKNLAVKVMYNNVYIEGEFLKFDVQTEAKDGTYRKKLQASVKIKNPWDKDIVSEENETTSESENVESIAHSDDENITNIQGITKEKDYIDERSLIQIYDIKEL
ncbi:hypothetical protein CHL78_004295 [Romboutsia weinsteinii]|uniref:Type 4 fimbrial biogenesis protein PilX N-terminal domain-containing protein n=1 Tax=Romboutsia weinsteinii TaxID=2020949 RepID=A0A371J7T6_9FIRM|nr:hypothetical protein [Romboutsia weinsteinii]RDY28763.1 hypothetical protein CHL78_004295 [Romboutsia weinsteinii]